jgi:stage III sporulation protein AG
MEKLSGILKMKGIGFIILAFIAGLILLVLPQEKKESVSPVQTSSEYVASLEDSLEKLLKKMCGHECNVMIAVETGYSYSYAANEKLDTTYGDGSAVNKSVSKEYVVVSENGDESLVIIKETLPKIKGVAIACKKGNEEDRIKITSTVCALFGLKEENVGCVVG